MSRGPEDSEDVVFRLSSSREGDVAEVIVIGEVDSGTAARLTREVDDQLAKGAQAVRLDLSQTTFVDSSGLVALLDLRAAVGTHGAPLTLVRLSRPVRRVLELTELISAFNVET